MLVFAFLWGHGLQLCSAWLQVLADWLMFSNFVSFCICVIMDVESLTCSWGRAIEIMKNSVGMDFGSWPVRIPVCPPTILCSSATRRQGILKEGSCCHATMWLPNIILIIINFVPLFHSHGYLCANNALWLFKLIANSEQPSEEFRMWLGSVAVRSPDGAPSSR